MSRVLPQQRGGSARWSPSTAPRIIFSARHGLEVRAVLVAREQYIVHLVGTIQHIDVQRPPCQQGALWKFLGYAGACRRSEPQMLAVLSSYADVPLVSFDGAVPLSKFVQLNDPVMGGRSSGTWSVDAVGKFGKFDGTVLDVPSLKAPGFIKVKARHQP